MSQQPDNPQAQPQQKVNPLGFLKFGRGDSRMAGINKLLSSDKDNETKTRIPNVLGMTYLDCTGALHSPHDYMVLKVQDQETDKSKEITVPKTVEGMALIFGARYRINAISARGQSRGEYVDALKSYLLGQVETQGISQARMEEGVKKKP